MSTDAERKPLVVLRPEPQSTARIFTERALSELRARFEVVDLGGRPTDDDLDDLLPDVFAIVGQPDLPASRLQRATNLEVLVNVEGNFFPNVDYAACFANGIRVLGCGPAYAQAVAEFALGLAIDLARGISREDRAFRAGREQYLGERTHDAILLRHADIGLVGFGNLGRALLRLLAAFAPTVRVFDPWLPDSVLRDADVVPCSLEETLRTSRFLFVVASVTDSNANLLDAERLDLIPEGARVIVVSRAGVVDFPELLRRVEAGRFLAAVDVWPDEPVPADHPARALEGLVLSPHRAGGIPAAFQEIGDMVLDDLTLIADGLPPARLQPAAPELVGRYRNKPAEHKAAG